MSPFDSSSDAYFDSRPHRRASLGPLIIGGVIAAVMLAWRSPFADWIRGFLSDWPNPAEGSPFPLEQRGFAPAGIRRSVLGRGKSTIASVYGPPRTAAPPRQARSSPRDSFWNADTWYYPIDSATQMAMAVRFENGVARHVEFFQSPSISGHSQLAS